MYKLERWYKGIVAPYERLKLSEAQELIKKANLTEDEKLKKEYIDKVVLGTLYVIYEFIKNNEFSFLHSSSYDMDDIINVFCELWIKEIKNGNLLKVQNFSNIFTHTFFNNVTRNLISEHVDIKGNFGITSSQLLDMFIIYLELKKFNDDVTMRDIVNELKKNSNYASHKYINDMDDTIIILFNNIYKNIKADENKEINIAKTKLNELLRLFINMGMFVRLNANLKADNDLLEDSINKITVDKIIESTNLSERELEVLKLRFGLDENDDYTLAEVGNLLNTSLSTVEQTEIKALLKIRYKVNNK